jgi:hypothetical protein
MSCSMFVPRLCHVRPGAHWFCLMYNRTLAGGWPDGREFASCAMVHWLVGGLTGECWLYACRVLQSTFVPCISMSVSQATLVESESRHMTDAMAPHQAARAGNACMRCVVFCYFAFQLFG